MRTVKYNLLPCKIADQYANRRVMLNRRAVIKQFWLVYLEQFRMLRGDACSDTKQHQGLVVLV